MGYNAIRYGILLIVTKREAVAATADAVLIFAAGVTIFIGIVVILRFVMEKVDPIMVEAIDRVFAVNVDAWMFEVTTRLFIERVDPWIVEVNIALDVNVDPISVENVMNCVWIVETWIVDTNKVEAIERVFNVIVDPWIVEAINRVFIERVDPWIVEVNIVLDVSVDPCKIDIEI